MVFDKKTAADHGMENMANIVIPHGATTIGLLSSHIGEKGMSEYLQSVVMPNTVTVIDAQAFYWCGKLTDIRLSESLKIIGREAFMGCTNLQKIAMPDSVIDIEESAFNSCTYLMEINISNKVEVIKKRTFYGCKYLREITIPDGVTSIHEEAFAQCENLQRITIPNSVEYIAHNAFKGCNNLTIHYSPSQEKWFDLFRKKTYVEKYVKERKANKQFIKIKPAYSSHGISIKEIKANETDGKVTTKQSIEAYIVKIAHFGNVIRDNEVLKHIKDIKDILGQMAEIEEIENWRNQLYSFLNRDLPFVEKILNTYCQLSDKKGAVKISEEIAEALPVIKKSFEKYLKDMYEGKRLEISTDIEVIKTMLAKDGLLDEDIFKIEK